MPYPLLRPLAARFRALQTPLLYRLVLRRHSHPLSLTHQPALVVAPHHDDETFGCGGMIALKRSAGVPVSVVVITDGSQSHASLNGASAEIVASRKQELTDATALLGLSQRDLHFLDGPDGGLHLLTGAARATLVNNLARVIDRSGAREIYVPHRHDLHVDHEMSHQIALEAIALAGAEIDLLEYPIWILWKRTPLTGRLSEVRGAGRLDVSDVQALKDRAIAVYQSQLPSMPPGFLPQFSNGEEFYWKRTVTPERRGAPDPAGAVSPRSARETSAA